MDELFLRWNKIVEKNSNNIAIEHRTNKISYLELNRVIRRYIYRLKSCYIQSKSVVGIYMDSSIDYWAAVMSVLFCDCIFVPLDKKLPEERIKTMLELSDIKMIISDEDKKLDLFSDCQYIRTNEINNCDEEYDVEKDGIQCVLAYILFTSGTSGVPKGVMVNRMGLLNLINWYGEKYNINNDTKLLQLASISFDVAIEEYFGTLLNGGIVVIADEKSKYHSKWFSKQVEEHKVTMVQMIPRMAKTLLCQIEKPNSLSTIILGAEQLDEELKNLLLSKGYNLYNHYGPTECTVDVLTSECRCDESVNIGIPIDNMNCYIIDEYNNLISQYEVIGELIVTGPGVAEGYIGNSLETQRAFQYIEGLPERAYKTGDLVYLNKKGRYVFVGRKDDQIKINGQRIEIKEIEGVVSRIKDVRECCAMVLGEGIEKIIVLFWSGSASIEAIKYHLKQSMPSYMIPKNYIDISDFPVMENGKLDRMRLADIYELRKKNGANITYEKKYKQEIIDVFCKALEQTEEEFYKVIYNSLEIVGIDSIMLVQILVEIEEKFDVELDDDFLLATEFENIDDLIEKIGVEIEKK